MANLTDTKHWRYTFLRHMAIKKYYIYFLRRGLFIPVTTVSAVARSHQGLIAN